MIEGVKKGAVHFQFRWFSMATGPTSKNTVGPAPALHKHFGLKVQVCALLAGPALADSFFFLICFAVRVF